VNTYLQFEIEGYSMNRLLTEHNMTPIAAFLTLDWLMREPAIALASLNKGRESLVKNTATIQSEKKGDGFI